MQSDKKSLAGI